MSEPVVKEIELNAVTGKTRNYFMYWLEEKLKIATTLGNPASISTGGRQCAMPHDGLL